MTSDLSRREISQILTKIENREAAELFKLRSLYKPETFSRSICFTGPGGAGKSTLLSHLSQLASQKRSVAWVACDPSSAVTGGSVLGDRIRLSGAETPENLFVRSMSTRSSAAYSQAIRDVEVFLESEFDEVWVETAGSGQTQTEISKIAGLTVLVLQPETGDEIQWMKAGLQEETDIFVVNKADLDGADLMKNLLIEQGADENRVIEVSSKTQTGFQTLLQTIDVVRKSISWPERQLKVGEAHAKALFLEKKMAELEKDFESQKAELISKPYG